MKLKLLQIDLCLNTLSTGRITESIGKLAMEKGWECYIVHGARYVKRPSKMYSIQTDNVWQEYLHYAESLFFDRQGLASRITTRKVIEQIRVIAPDIIQLHCIHGSYLNYKLLFEYLNSTNIPVVWTFHDCWAFTGHCAHFVTANCKKWKEEGCHDCPLKGEYPKSFVDRSERNYRIKKELFSANKNLHIVAVSEWLANFTRESFLGDKDLRVINNGIDINLFKPDAEKSLDVFNIIGVASAWNADKGLFDFFKLRETLPKDYQITLVGLTESQIKRLPVGIKGLSKTDSIEQLAEFYSMANVLVNPTYADSFPTVNMEALACGTPVITYNTGGSPEIIDTKTGFVVEQGDVAGLTSAILTMKKKPLSSADCRKRAVRLYNKDERFVEYIKLYESLIN